MTTPTATEIAPDTFRISTFNPDYGIQFNQFLIRDDEPFLMHTGLKRMFQSTLAGVRSILDPATLRWIGYSHFEPDECGALNDWMALAPRAQALTGFVGSTVMLQDFADRPPRTLADDEVLPIGRHRLRFLATPHVPHGWDAGMFFDETEGTLFCSDLFFEPGDPVPLLEGDVVARARDALVAGVDGPLTNDLPYGPRTDRTLRRLADLAPRTLAVMHGSSYRGDGGAALLGLAKVLANVLGPRA
jgi:glyoxylase-like metal-dependent hydrolase (beta-lactamase superfamily II)